METTTDGACPPISRAREGAGAVRLGGPAWRRVHPLAALGMASVRSLQDAATQRGIALEKQIRRQTSRGLMRSARTWRTRGPRWSAGHASASKRPMRRDEPERPRLRRTRLSDAAKAGEPAYPGYNPGLARDSAPLNPGRPALRWSSRAGASPRFPPWRRIPMGKRRTVLVPVRVTAAEFADRRAMAVADRAGAPGAGHVRSPGHDAHQVPCARRRGGRPAETQSPPTP